MGAGDWRMGKDGAKGPLCLFQPCGGQGSSALLFFIYTMVITSLSLKKEYIKESTWFFSQVDLGSNLGTARNELCDLVCVTVLSISGW